MARDVYVPVTQCASYALSGCGYKPMRQALLFCAQGSLKFDAMNNLEPFSTTFQENKYVLVTTDQKFKLTRTMPTLKIAASLVPKLLFDYWMLPFINPAKRLTEVRAQFASKCLRSVKWQRSIKHVTTRSYLLQTKRTSEGIKKLSSSAWDISWNINKDETYLCEILQSRKLRKYSEVQGYHRTALNGFDHYPAIPS